jgi:hypothetical protein
MQNPSSDVVTLISAGALSGSITSGGYYVGDASSVCIQGAFTTNDAVGTISLEGSLDGSSWTDIPISPQPSVAGADTSFLLELPDTCLQSVRLKYNRTSGSNGSLTAKIFAKRG